MASRAHSVRIIAGRWRGRRIRFAQDPLIRPTPDRVRETLFNWLQDHVSGARCLDLFAGSGALGLEALSRGASSCTFVDSSAAAAAAIRSSLDVLGGKGVVVQAQALAWLEASRPEGLTGTAVFDLVFLDPPFGRGLLPAIFRALVSGAWLQPGARIYVECERAAGVPELPSGWTLLRSKFAGEVGYHLACNDQENSGLPRNL